MNTDIKNLMEKYYRGETSLEEENYLSKRFSTEETKSDTDYNRLIFNTFKEEKEETAPICLKTFSPLHKGRFFSFLSKKWVYITGGMAACLLIALGTIFYQYQQENTAYVIIDGVRINDEQLAIEYVNKQFAEISCQINKGLDALHNVEENQRIVEEKLKLITKIYY